MNAEGRKQKAEVRIAELLRYPASGFTRSDEDSSEVCAFLDEVANVSRSGMEELYTTTFDLNPVATLEIGWHLWGEQYERGRFLAELRATQAAHGIEAGCELPDHLTLMLPTIAATRDERLRDACVKAIDKILLPLEEHGNPYRHLMRAAKEAIQ